MEPGLWGWGQIVGGCVKWGEGRGGHGKRIGEEVPEEV